MSLAGKILTVFITLILLAWIYLFTMVAQLNRNWGQAIAKQETRLTEQTASLADLKNKYVQVSQQYYKERSLSIDQLSALRRGIEDLLVRVSQEKENLQRAQLRLEDEESLAQTADAAVQRRQQEQADLKQALANLSIEIQDLKVTEGEMLAKLNDLMTEFSNLTAQNQELLEKRAGDLPSSSTNFANDFIVR